MGIDCVIMGGGGEWLLNSAWLALDTFNVHASYSSQCWYGSSS